MLHDAQSQGFPAVGFGGDDLDMAPTQGDERKKRKVDFNEDEELSRIIDEANKNLSKEVKERVQKIMSKYVKNVKEKLKYKAFLEKDNKDIEMLGRHEQPNGIKQFKADEKRAELDHVMTNTEQKMQVVFKPGCTFRQGMKELHFAYQKQFENVVGFNELHQT